MTDEQLVTGEPMATVKEIARDARVSRMSIYRLIHAGELAHIRVGRSYRVPVAAARALLAPTTGGAR